MRNQGDFYSRQNQKDTVLYNGDILLFDRIVLHIHVY